MQQPTLFDTLEYQTNDKTVTQMRYAVMAEKNLTVDNIRRIAAKYGVTCKAVMDFIEYDRENSK